MADEDIGALAVRIAMEDSSFQQGVQDLKRQISEVDSGFKSSVAGVKDWGNNLDGLKSNAQALGDKINIQKQIVQQYQEQLDKSKQSLSDNSSKMMELKEKVDVAKTAWQESETTLGKNAEQTKNLKKTYEDLNAEYGKSEDKVRNNNKSVEGYSIQLNNATGKLKDMESAVSETNDKIDNQSNVFNKAKEKISQGLEDMKTAFGALGIATGAFLQSTISTAESFQGINENLEQTIKSTGGAAGLTAKQVEDMAGKFQMSTTFSKGTIEAGQSMLLTFTNIGKNVFPMATQALLDMSQKMGTEPKQAAIQLGKALNDPVKGITALTRVGVTFTGQQKETIKQMVATGNTAGAQKLIIQELEREFGGQATAATKTYDGQMQQLQNTFNSTKAQIGTALLPILAQLGQTLAQILKPIAEFIQQNPKLTAGLLSIVAVLGTMIGGASIIDKVAGALGPLGEALTGTEMAASEMIKPMMGVIGVIGLLAAAYTKNLGGFKDFVNDVFSKVSTVIQAFVDIWNDKCTAALDKLGPIFGKNTANISVDLYAITDSIKVFADILTGNVKKSKDILDDWAGPDADKNSGNLVRMFANIATGIKTTINTIISIVKAVWPTVSTILKDIFKAIGDIINFITSHQALVQTILVGIGTMLATMQVAKKIIAIKDAVEGVIDSAKKLKDLSNIGSTLSKAFGVSPQILLIAAIIAAVAALAFVIIKNWGPISTFFKNLWAGIKSNTEAVWNGIKAFFVNTWNGIVGSVKTIWNGIGTFFSTLWNGVKTITQAAWNGIKTVVMAIITPFINGIINIWNSMKNGITTVMNGLKTFFTGIWNTIKTIFLGAILLLTDLWPTNWNKMGKDVKLIMQALQKAFGQIWDGIKQIFTGTVQAIAGFLTTEWNGIVNIATAVWNGLKQFFVGLWEGIKSGAVNGWNALRTGVVNIVDGTINWIKTAWENILNWFRNLPGNLYHIGVDIFNGLKNGINSVLSTLGGWIKTGFNGVVNFFKNLPGEALKWGADMINGFVNGIKNTFGAIGKAVNDVASKIRGVLHFSVPDEGPLKDYESWMPDFMKGMAEGINKNKNIVTKAIQGLASDVNVGMRLNPSALNSEKYSNNTVQKDRDALKSKGITQYITINSTVPLNPSEIIRKQKQAEKELALQWGL